MRRFVTLLLVAFTVAGCREIPQASDGASGAGTRTGAAPAAAAVPDVRGKRLPDAIAALSRSGFTKVKPVDGTGQSRFVINEHNWVVSSQTPAGGSRASVHGVVTVRVVKPSDSVPSAHPVSGVVPRVLCEDLQTARDSLRGAGFHDLGTQDGTGKGRIPIIGRNWVVTGQSVPAATKPSRDIRVVLTVVKFGEPTGRSGCRS